MLTYILFVIGLALIAKGGDWFADGAIAIADHTGLPKALIGATLVSIATTMPEFVVSVVAVLSGSPGTSVGNAIGSTSANMGMILAVAVLIYPLKDQRGTTRFLVGSMIVVTLVFLALARNHVLSRLDAVLLLVLLTVYMTMQARFALQGNADRKRAREEAAALDPVAHARRGSLGKEFAMFGVGGAAVLIGSHLVVKNGIEIARAIGVSELVIGLTLVSVGTSLPELVTAVSAALKRHTELAVGNVLGANVLNIAWVLPGAALFRPLEISSQTLVLDVPLSLALMLVIALTLGWRGALKRPVAACMLTGYLAYVVFLFL